MKLAEALILRSDQKKRIEQLRQRLTRNAKVQEGDHPTEDPTALLHELEAIFTEMTRLIQRINRTNSTTFLQPGVSLADAIATRDSFVQKHEIYRALAQAATVTQDLRTKSEVRFRSTVKVAQIQEMADGMAKAHRELDMQIQELNWKTDLAE